MSHTKMWRRVAATILTASFLAALATVGSTPNRAVAYNENFPTAYWVSRSAQNGYDFYIPVCLATNFWGYSGSGGGWDLSKLWHQRVADAIDILNGENFDGFYYRTAQSCTYMRNQDIPHLELAQENDAGNNLALTQITEQDFPCAHHCASVYRISFQPDDTMYGNGWYVGDSVTVPYLKADAGEVVIHELGHASGLLHSQITWSQMCGAPWYWINGGCDSENWIWGGGAAVRYMTADDEDGLQAIWGPQ